MWTCLVKQGGADVAGGREVRRMYSSVRARRGMERGPDACACPAYSLAEVRTPVNGRNADAYGWGRDFVTSA